MSVYYKNFEKNFDGAKKYLTKENCAKINEHFKSLYVLNFGIDGFNWDDAFCLAENNIGTFDYFYAERGFVYDIKSIDSIVEVIDFVCNNELLKEYSNIDPEDAKKYLYGVLGLENNKMLVK